MARNNDAFERAFEEMLREASVKADEELGRELPEPEEEIIFSEAHERKMHNMFRRELRKLRNKKILKYSKWCACILAVFVTVSAVTVYKTDALRNMFINFVVEDGARNTDFNFGEEKISSYEDKDISIGYIPAGFELTEYDDGWGIFFCFENGDKYFGVSQDDIEITHNVDTEDMEIERFKIKGYDAVFLTKPRVSILLWCNDKYGYVLYGNIPKEEMVKIAKNINSKH